MEKRLQSHSYTYDKVLGESQKKLELYFKKIDDIYKLVLEHDAFFKKIDADTIMIIVEQYKEVRDFKKVGKIYLKSLGIVSGILGALYVIKGFLTSAIHYLK